MTPIVVTCSLIVQMCVKSQVGYYSRKAGTIEQRFSFLKTYIILLPVCTLNIQALYDTDNFALVMYYFVCLLTFTSVFMASGLIIRNSGRGQSINL